MNRRDKPCLLLTLETPRAAKLELKGRPAAAAAAAAAAARAAAGQAAWNNNESMLQAAATPSNSLSI
jgi:hypothetical protein